MKKKNENNFKSVKWVLLSLNLEDYSHVCIREHGDHKIEMVGGGHPGDVIRRYGDRLVVDSCICDNVLFLYVLPVDTQISDMWGDFCDIRNDFCVCTGKCSHCFSPAINYICPLDVEVSNG